jgi:hypothetical protein
MKRLVLLKVVRNPRYDVAIDAIQIGDKITLDSGPFSAQNLCKRALCL